MLKNEEITLRVEELTYLKNGSDDLDEGKWWTNCVHDLGSNKFQTKT